MTRNEEAYAALVKLSEHIGLPEQYKDDLYEHDRRTLGTIRIPEARLTLEATDGTPFVWIVRSTGTDIVYIGRPAAINGDLYIINLSVLRYREKYGDSTMRAYWWDGLGPGLEEIRIDQARGKLFEGHYKFKHGAAALNS